MSAPGWVQLTSPVPEASDCSASNPSAIRPVAATAVPPPPGAVTVVTAPVADTVTGAAPFVFADGLPLAAGFPAADGAARTALNMALPVGVPAGLAALGFAAEPAPAACAGSAIIEIRAAAEPGAGGGQDLVIDVTAAS